MDIVTIAEKKDERFLRQKTKLVTFPVLSIQTLRALIRDMKQTMRAADGVGLSANQVGLDMHLFIGEVPDAECSRNKFYAIVNPEIVKASKETEKMEEGCLSVPGVFGTVERPDRITVAGFDIYGKRIKIKAWGFLARVLQHEIDHLNGTLFIDKAKGLHTLQASNKKSS